jgi:homopolymeric O-antigen transport system ATP-binding protein
MNQTVIRVEGLGKRYRIGEGVRHTALRHLIGDVLRAPVRLLTGSSHSSNPRPGAGSLAGNTVPGAAVSANGNSRFIWALKHVNFEVRQGEVVGLIGRNGAGKSTLLKILSRITRPTEGHAEIHGRVGSLLEVGTGFHGELSGRENVYMSGAILGMRKAEIDRKFDEIVAFSEVERFLDTPLKHYSSGMQMRLAFAVAAHLEPEILFVDEVLAVGDAAFQKKCLGKMSDVARNGRTIIFVSHNVAAVTRLCSRCILMDSGQILKDGSTHEAMNTYLRSELGASACREWGLADAPGDKVTRLRAVRVRSAVGMVAEAFDIRQPIGIDIVFDVLVDGNLLTPNIHLFNEEGVNVFVSIDTDPNWRSRPRPAGRYTSTAWIPGNFLSEGTCVVGAAITTFIPMNVRLYARDAIAFQVVDSTDGDSVRGDYAATLPGVVRPLLKWETNYAADIEDHSKPTRPDEKVRL